MVRNELQGEEPWEARTFDQLWIGTGPPPTPTISRLSMISVMMMPSWSIRNQANAFEAVVTFKPTELYSIAKAL